MVAARLDWVCGGDQTGEVEGDAVQQMQALGIHPEAMSRQLLAIVDAGDRSERVRSISVPTLVQHGADDTLLPPPHGAHTAELVVGAEYVVYEGMGHNLPDEVVPLLVKDIVDHLQGAE